MKKDKKRKADISAKAKKESLRFQTIWGAKQKLNELTPEIETRIDEELRLFANLQLIADLLVLKTIIDNIKNKLGINNEPTRGMLAGSMVAFCLGIEPQNPISGGQVMDLSDLTLPLQLTISYDNEIRQDVTNWLTANGYNMSTYMGQPLIKLTNSRIVIRRVVKP